MLLRELGKRALEVGLAIFWPPFLLFSENVWDL